MEYTSELYVGRSGGGTLSIRAGGAVTNTTGYLGYDPGSTGEATVNGAGSQWINIGPLHVGHSGNGRLNIEAGGIVTSSIGYLGYNPGYTAEVVVTGAGSRWDNALELRLKRSSKLSIEAGGTVSNTKAYVSELSGEASEVTVSGTGSHWNNSQNLLLGGAGSGKLVIKGGGLVTNTDGWLGYSWYSTGEVTVSGAGSQWRNSRDLSVGILGSGTLTISHGALVSVASSLTIDTNLNDDGFVNLSTGGKLALASSATGDDSLADFLSLVKGTKAIRYWDDALSDWASITAATYGDDYTLEYVTSGDLAGYTLLTVGELPPMLAGAYNSDGVGDAADYTVWRDNQGGPAGTLPNDVDGGEVGAAQYETWRTNYGSVATSSAPATNTAVPEPSSGLIALSGLAFVGIARRVATTPTKCSRDDRGEVTPRTAKCSL